MKKRSVAIVLSLVLVFCCAVGGVLAWLTAKTDPVVNTFTVGNIDIKLDESKNLDLKMVPDNTIKKDPKVTVEAGSEACWLFVKVDKSDNFDDFMTYELAAGWTQLEGVQEEVYYRQVDAAAEDVRFSVLSDDKVTVKEDVTKDMMDKLTIGTQPTLTFTAYACQLAKGDNQFTPAEAWAEVNPTAPAE